jgi:hypothetical protein
MKTLIKEIKSITKDGIGFELTEEARLNHGMKAKQWFVSWDKIGAALFGDQYDDIDSRCEPVRGEI